VSVAWTQRDGTKIPLDRMTDTHLVNAMAMCMRNSERIDLPEAKRKVANYWVEMFKTEMRLREREHHLFDDDDLCIDGVDRYGSLQ
jgi:hypothetical protein